MKCQHRRILRSVPALAGVVIAGNLAFALNFAGPAVLPGGVQPDDVRNVLVVNSYNQGYPWTDELVRGIRSVLETGSNPPELWVEYLDSRRSGNEGGKALETLLAAKYGSRRLELIMVSDDDALLLMKGIHDRMFPGVPVVFCGINDVSAIAGLPRQIYTGVLEFFEVESILKLALGFHPGTERVIVISDNSITGESQRRAFEEIALRRTDLRFDFLSGTSLLLDEILDALRQSPGNSLVLTTGFSRDASAAPIPAEEAHRRIAEASTCPVYSPSISDLGQGIVGGSDNGGFRHGGLAARLALRILEGENPAQVAVLEDREVSYVFDGARLEELGIPFPSLPPFSRVVNHAPSLYQQYRGLFWSVLVFLGAQTLIIALLVVNIVRRRTAERENLARAEELSRRNQDLAALNRSLADQVEERKKAQAALSVSEASLARAQKVADLGSWEYRPDDGGMVWSDQLFSILGVEPGSVEPSLEALRQFINSSERDRLLNGLSAALAGGVAFSEECRLVRAEGSEVVVRMLAELVDGPAGRRLVGTVQDVTEFRRMEEQLRQSQKLEAVGRLAGGVAHDFNNLLTVVNCYCEMLLSGLDQKDPMRNSLEEIYKAGQKAADLTAHLLAFSRHHVIQKRLLDLNQILRDSEKMFRRLIGADIEIQLDLAEGLGRTLADPGQVHQIALNLVLNGRDAMPGCGTLKISTLPVSVGHEVASWGAEFKPGDYLKLTVADSGMGMDEETVRRVYEPYFTTKAAGKGSGLGLSTVYGIVKQLGGFIEISSSRGHGTEVRVYLPRAEELGGPALDLGEGALLGNETLLLVEDQDEVLEVVARALRSFGYDVRSACGAQEAIEISLSCPDPIHLLITDVVMPGIRGPDLADRIRRDRPGIAVLYISGYSDATVLGLGEAVERTAFLQKPFRPEILAAKVRELLARPAAR